MAAGERDLTRVRTEVLRRKAKAGAGPETDARRRALAAVTAALEGADPKTVLARGYAIVEAPSGEPVTSAAEARTQQELLPLQQPPTPHPLRSTTPSDSRVLAAAAAANMVHIDEAVKLDFKDVLIRPKRSTLKSRSQVRCVGTLCWGSGLWVR